MSHDLKLPLSVTVIYPTTGVTLADVEFVLSTLPAKSFRLDRRPVNILDEPSIARALSRSHHADVVLLIRGGGPDEDFAVFSSPVLRELFRKLPGYRITGIGHAPHHTPLDDLADYAGSTPTDAAYHLAAIVKDLATGKSFSPPVRRQELDDLPYARHPLFGNNIRPGFLLSDSAFCQVDVDQRVIDAIAGSYPDKPTPSASADAFGQRQPWMDAPLTPRSLVKLGFRLWLLATIVGLIAMVLILQI